MTVDSFTLWAPGLHVKDDWEQWLDGKKEMEDTAEAPKILSVSPIVQRRFSQITKMACHVAEVLTLESDALYFTSVRGEINVQYKVNLSFAKEKALSPSVFALSVFNTPPAEATICLSSQIPYTPIFSGEKDVIRNLFLVGTSPLRSGKYSKVTLVYAEERTPDEYRENIKSYGLLKPMAIGVQLSKDGNDDIPESALFSPESLAKFLIGEMSERWA